MQRFSYLRHKPSIAPVIVKSDVSPATAELTLMERILTGPKRPSVQVRPDNPSNTSWANTPPPNTLASFKLHELAVALYYWMTCLFIVGLVCSQLLGAIWDSKTTTEHIVYGRSPLLGPYQIVGTNDIPYADRVVACVRSGQAYEPRRVSSLLAAPGFTAILEDSTGTAVHGYRLKQRRVGSVTDVLDSRAEAVLASSCQLIAQTVDNILDACSALGYTNLTRDNLRVVDDWDSKNLHVLPNTLPVLIMPYYDNAAFARHAVPTWGGDSCIFRLQDAYSAINSFSAKASFRGVNKSVRNERTIEWLGRPGGIWKNGWYEDLEGIRWYSDLKSSVTGPPYNMMHRDFDMRSGKETDCSDLNNCEGIMKFEWWGSKFSAGNRAHKFNSLYVANATGFGLALYESHELRAVRSVYDWETLLSNVSVAFILIRWVLALVSLHIGALRGTSQWHGGGIGCVSGAGSFLYLPLTSLPRLKMTLAAFWTVGCRFEGQQAALAETWFAFYPAIVHSVLIYYSVLNWLAKLMRRRVTDILFTPTVMVFCLMHYFRAELASSGWLKGVNGRQPTVVFSDEIKKLELVDYFTTDVAWRLNGRITLLYAVKLAILGVNLLPLVLSRSFPVGKRCADLGLHGVEKALALQASHVGGLGQSLSYVVGDFDTKERRLSSSRLAARINSISSDGSSPITHGKVTINVVQHAIPPSNDIPGPKEITISREIALVNSYELTRLGYVVFGDKYLIRFDEWDLLSSMAPFRSFCHLWNHRVLVWTLRSTTSKSDAELAGGRELKCTEPEIWRLDDPRLQRIRWWQVSACNIQC